MERALEDRDTPAFRRRMARRMAVVEGSFGIAKEQHCHRRTRWRGKWKMQVQCYLVASIQNLKKLLKWAWNLVEPIGIRPPRQRQIPVFSSMRTYPVNLSLFFVLNISAGNNR